MKRMDQMQYHYGVKVRIYPSSKQKQVIKNSSDASRFVYNESVAIDREMYQLKRIKIPVDTIVSRIAQLSQRKSVREMANHYSFLHNKQVHSDVFANAIKNYKQAWKMFRKVHEAGTPNFHRKSYSWNYQLSNRYPGVDVPLLSNGNIRLTDRKHVKLPKLGILQISRLPKRILNRLLNGVETRIGTVTISKNACDEFFVSFQLASDIPFVESVAKTNSQVGVDLNTENFLTTSDNRTVTNPRYYRKILKRLKKHQRILSRRQRRAKVEGRSLRDSKNYQKQRLLVAKIQSRVANQRRNFLQQMSTALIKNHDLVVAEELKSKNMLRNHALAMSISDVGWRSFLQMLDYKAGLYGKKFVSVNPRNTTQTCHNCGFVMGTNDTDKLTLKDRQWTCPECGVFHIRDHNAALNILDRGLEKLAKEAKKSA